MAIMRVYDDTVGKGACRSCAAPVTWAEIAASGKKMPFDGDLVYVRTIVIDGRVIGEVDTTVNESHFASCPDAEKWRKK